MSPLLHSDPTIEIIGNFEPLKACRTSGNAVVCVEATQPLAPDGLIASASSAETGNSTTRSCDGSLIRLAIPLQRADAMRKQVRLLVL